MENDSVPRASGAVGEPPASMLMLMLLGGFQISQALYVAARLDIATALIDGPLPVGELAVRTQADPTAPRRLVRTLAAQGVFRTDGELVQLTGLGATLADQQPGSVRAGALYWMETHYPAGARLVIIETVVTPGDEPELAKALDLTMLAMGSGLERTEEEYRKLLDSAGFVLDRVVPSPTLFSFIEASPR